MSDFWFFNCLYMQREKSLCYKGTLRNTFIYECHNISYKTLNETSVWLTWCKGTASWDKEEESKNPMWIFISLITNQERVFLKG